MALTKDFNRLSVPQMRSQPGSTRFYQVIKTIFVVLIVLSVFVIFFHPFFLPSNRIPPISPFSCDFAPDHPYTSIINRDIRTRFLDPEVRDFFNRTCNLPYPRRYQNVFRDTLFEFDRIWREKLNRTYVLGGGTLLGAYRHGQTAPWDDDLDIYVHVKYNKTLDIDFNGTKFAMGRSIILVKLFFVHDGTTTNAYGHWPFIDLFFYDEKDGKVIMMDYDNVILPYRYMFPEIRIPHEGRMISVPRCPRAFLHNYYGNRNITFLSTSFLQKCSAYRYNHKRDKLFETRHISCSKLYGLFQFVKWRRINASHTMQLVSYPNSSYRVWKEGAIVYMPECD